MPTTPMRSSTKQLKNRLGGVRMFTERGIYMHPGGVTKIPAIPFHDFGVKQLARNMADKGLRARVACAQKHRKIGDPFQRCQVAVSR